MVRRPIRMRKQRIITGTVTALALLTLAACGTEPAPGDAGGSVRTELPLTDVRWNIESVTADGRRTAAPVTATLEIDTAGRAGVRTGCNSIGARVAVDGDTVTVGEKQSTKIGCREGLAAFENAFNDVFAGKLTVGIDGERLTLTGGDGDLIALTSEPAVPLVGPEWTVAGLIGDGSTSLVPGGARAYFTFAEDGTVEGNGGCNNFGGAAKISGSTVTFGHLVFTDKLCSGPRMTLERRVGKVLEGRVTYELGHRSLALVPADGTGLRATTAGP